MSVAADLFPGVEVIDVHAHLGRWGYPGIAGTLDDFRRLVDGAGFHKVIVSSGLALMYDVPEGNAETAAAVASDERLYGSVVFNAHDYGQSCEQVDRYADQPRFVSAKLHPSFTGLALNSAENLRVIERIAARGLPLTFHAWTGAGAAAADIARRFPSLPVIWFHALAADYRQAVVLARELPNVYLEYVTSTQERDKIETLVEGVGANRMLFGTDQSLFDPIRPLAALAEARIRDSDRRQILSQTARRVFKFG